LPNVKNGKALAFFIESSSASFPDKSLFDLDYSVEIIAG